MGEKFSNTEKIEINSSLERTWDAIVNPEKIKKYLFGTEQFAIGKSAAR